MLLVVQARRRRARRRARLPARPQAPRRRMVGARLRARLPALPADAVARRRRLPSGRARDAAPARGDLVPRREPAGAVRALRRRRVPDEGAGRARRRDARHLARLRARAAARRPRDLRRRALPWRSIAAAVVDPALRAGRRVAVRRPLRRGRRLAGGHRQDRRARTRCASSRSRSSAATSATSGSSSRRSAACRCSRRSSRSSALPEIALNLLSSTPTQSSIHFHYTAGAIPGLVAGAVLGGAKLRRPPSPGSWPCAGRGARRRSCSWPGIVLGPLPVWRHVPFGSTLAARHHIVSEHDRAAARVIRAVPADAPVSATNNLGAHLSERRRIFSFPVLARGALGRGRPDAAELPRRRDREEVRRRVRTAAGGHALAGRPGRGRRHRPPQGRRPA